jgi:hypothetical protein
LKTLKIGYRLVLPVYRSGNKTAQQTTDDETKGLVSGEAADIKSQTQIRLWAAAHQKPIEISRKSGGFHENRVVFTSTNFADCVALIFLNSVLTKTLEIASSFFRIFYFIFFKCFKIFKFTGRFLKTSKTGPDRFSDFHENRPVFQTMTAATWNASSGLIS